MYTFVIGVFMKKHMNFIEVRLKDADKLLNEIHYYIKWQAPLDIQSMSRDEIFKVSCEAMRMTVRVTQIIGWLMLQKSILAGEFSREAVLADKVQILHGKLCLESESEDDLQLPTRLRELLKKTRELYLHTMRLEELSMRAPPLADEIKEEGGIKPVPLLTKKDLVDAG